jgi:adenine-specific DNA-methyltransferase
MAKRNSSLVCQYLENISRKMLEEESKNSPSLLNVSAFDDPFSYQLMVGTGSAGETQPVNVDLIETFNYLIGLKINSIKTFQTKPQIDTDEHGSKNKNISVNPCPSVVTKDRFVVIEGENLAGKKILVIWRKVCDLNLSDDEKIAARAKSNEELDAFFKKQQYNTLDMEFDLIYVNGDNNLMNIPVTPEGEGAQPRYKVRLIEEEFKKLMFDVEGIN